jgi:GNAT superfamily N-acetyltransferase
MSIQIRRATPQDIESVLLLVRDFVTSFEIVESKFRQSYAEVLDSSNSIALVADDGGDPIGYCLGFCHDTFYANGRVAWLEEIMVAPSYRRQRIGESLMDSFEEWAKSKGAVLSALATRRAAKFYQAIDYEESAAYFRKILNLAQ